MLLTILAQAIIFEAVAKFLLNRSGICVEMSKYWYHNTYVHAYCSLI